MDVQTAIGDVVEDALVLIPDEMFQLIFAVGIIQQHRIGCPPGIDEFPTPVDQCFEEMGARPPLLGLDKEGDPRIENGC